MNWFKKYGWILFLAITLSMGGYNYFKINPQKNSGNITKYTVEYSPKYEIIANKQTLIWPENTKIDKNLASYFYATIPTVEITPVMTSSNLEDINISGNVKTKINIDAFSERDELYWSYPIEEEIVSGFKIANGKIEYSPEKKIIDVLSMKAISDKISAELSFDKFIIKISYTSQIVGEGEIGNSKVNINHTNLLPIILRNERFNIDPESALTSQITLDASKNNDVSESDLFWSNIGENWILLFINFTMLLITLSMFKVSHDQRNNNITEYKKYKEWITDGYVDLTDVRIINIKTLEGLVNLGLDHTKRILYDKDRLNYIVIDDGVAYVYDPNNKNK